MTDGLMFIDIAEEEGDDKSISEILESFQSLEQSVAELEFSKMFTNKMDSASAYVEIQSGSEVLKLKIGLKCYLECIQSGLKVEVLILT